MKAPERKRSAGTDAWQELYGWITAFLTEKATPKRTIDWYSWANNRLRTGWGAEQVKERMREVWRLHNHGMTARMLESDLIDAIHEVYKMADKGWTPAQCAVVYRSLYRVHPTRHWLDEWAARWEAAGDDWKAVVMP